jgi:general stress protein YciG
VFETRRQTDRKIGGCANGLSGAGVGKGLDEKYGIDGVVGRKEEKHLDEKRSIEGERQGNTTSDSPREQDSARRGGEDGGGLNEEKPEFVQI